MFLRQWLTLKSKGFVAPTLLQMPSISFLPHVCNVSDETFTDFSDNEFNELDVTVEIVRDALNSSCDGTSPDLIPGQILRKCSNSLSIHFYNLIFFIIQSGDYLSPWKRTIFTPIFKDGRNAEMSHYRPIASLSKLSWKEILEESEEDLSQFETKVLKTKVSGQIQKYLQCVRKTPTIAPTGRNGSNASTNGNEKRELFNNNFVSVWRKWNENWEMKMTVPLNQLKVTQNQISDIMEHLNVNKSKIMRKLEILSQRNETVLSVSR